MLSRKKTVAILRKCAYVCFVITFFMIWILYLQTPTRPEQAAVLAKIKYVTTMDLRYLLTNLTFQSNDVENADSKFLVNSSKCKILSLDPYNTEILQYYNPKKYVKCSNKHLLTYLTKTSEGVTLRIDERFVNEYSADGTVNCCYRTVTRDDSATIPDMYINVSTCIQFRNSTKLLGNPVVVSCEDGRSQEIYKNVHAPIVPNRNVLRKMRKFDSSAKKKKKKRRHLSILLVGIDSVSRLNLARSMPKTHFFLQENGWLEFKGYNKIGENTFPNLMGFLTGMNETTAFRDCNPRQLGNLDECNIVWYDYRNLGYVTAFAEDEAEINTFNYLKKGFKREPTDYYFRSYVLATENYLDDLKLDVVKYCTGPESAGERILNLAQDFSRTFKDHPNFGFFWINSFGHNEVNAVSRMDGRLVAFLAGLNDTKVLENSVIIFISDHGFRFGSITYTHSGWLEERLPFLYVSVPKWFQKRHPTKYQNIVKNTEKLTTPYDLYMTLQDVLVVSGYEYEVRESSACPKCRSFFDEIESERSCEDAGIEHHWCTCSSYFTIVPQSVVAEEAARFIMNEIRRTVVNNGGDYDRCVDFEFKQIISAGISDADPKRIAHGNVYLLVTFETVPKSVFRATVSVNMNATVPVFKMEGGISRLDIYNDHSWCVGDSILKKYCYCQNGLRYVLKYAVMRVAGFLNSLVGT